MFQFQRFPFTEITSTSISVRNIADQTVDEAHVPSNDSFETSFTSDAVSLTFIGKQRFSQQLSVKASQMLLTIRMKKVNLAVTLKDDIWYLSCSTLVNS